MKKVLLAVIVALALTGCNRIHVQPKPTVTAMEQQQSTTHRIELFDILDGDSGHCSATAVGPHALLTAQHCFTNSNEIGIDKDEKTSHIQMAFLDGNDHVIYVVDRTFDTWAGISERELVSGEPVHMWGNPGKNRDVYRDGYFAKVEVEREKKMIFGMMVETGRSTSFYKFMLPIYPGDSGSGIMDANGDVISVVSLGDKSAENYNFPLSFTQAQLNMATGNP